MSAERFMLWLRTAPAGRRAEAAQALAGAYMRSQLSEEGRDAVEAAMTTLLDDPSPIVRLALAEALAPSDKAPHHLILSLAADRGQIAAVVAERSPVLLDTELVDMITAGDSTIQAAIARRPFISRALAFALSEAGSADACVELLCNGGARLPRFALDRMVERHGHEPRLRETLLAREDLPLVVRQALLSQLSHALRDFVVDRHWVKPDRAEAVMRDARDTATIAIAFEAPAGEVPQLVQRLIARDELTPAFLVRAAASGQRAVLEAALSALSGVPPSRVAALMSSGRAVHLKGLLQKAKLPERTFPVFAAAVDVIRNDGDGVGAAADYRRATRLIGAILCRYQSGPDQELDQMLALLRRFAMEAKKLAARGYLQQVTKAA